MAENDIALFLKDFSQTEQTLSDFHDLWRKKNMSCIYYCSPISREQRHFIREILEYIVRGIDRGVLLGKGAIFLLYACFVTQPSTNWLRVNIPITTTEMLNLRALVQAHCDRQVSSDLDYYFQTSLSIWLPVIFIKYLKLNLSQEQDVVYLFNKLMTVNAFEIVPAHDNLNWSTKQVPIERSVENSSISCLVCVALSYKCKGVRTQHGIPPD